jgi:hypothetical protein
MPEFTWATGKVPPATQKLAEARPADELQRHVERFGRVVPAGDSAAAVEVGADSNMIDSRDLHRVVDVVHEKL